MKRKTPKRYNIANIPAKLKNVDYVIDEQGCHVCISHSTKSTGYPRMRHPLTSDMRPVQRIVYERDIGQIPENKVITRTCGNKRCINPDHLELRDKKKTLEYLGIIPSA